MLDYFIQTNSKSFHKGYTHKSRNGCMSLPVTVEIIFTNCKYKSYTMWKINSHKSISWDITILSNHGVGRKKEGWSAWPTNLLKEYYDHGHKGIANLCIYVFS